MLKKRALKKFLLKVLIVAFLFFYFNYFSQKNLSQKQTPSKTKITTVYSDISLEISKKSYPVLAVVDGDTIIVDLDGKKETVRLIGIDAPEKDDPRTKVRCFGIQALNKAKELLIGKKVKLQGDPTQGNRDKYHRLLRYVFLENGENVNQLMISEGYAFEYTYHLPYFYQEKFKEKQIEAQKNERGLWNKNNCQN